MVGDRHQWHLQDVMAAHKAGVDWVRSLRDASDRTRLKGFLQGMGYFRRHYQEPIESVKKELIDAIVNKVFSCELIFSQQLDTYSESGPSNRDGRFTEIQLNLQTGEVTAQDITWRRG